MTKHNDKTESAPNTPGEHSESETPSTPKRESGDNARPRELGGRKGPEPTRYGDWEKKGRCIDF